ncbi:ATP-binding protein [Melittangium boletus]|uniref:ATP-binding protein n=1 Tax=Melittangium boletus TaxID=83453 RepID=UPI003DA42AF7
MSTTRMEAVAGGEAQAPRRRGVMPGGLMARLLPVLDALLPERVRAAPTEELSRGRLLVAALSLLLMCDALFLVSYVPHTEQPLPFIGIGAVCALGYGLAFGVLHWRGSTWLASLLLCAMLTGGYLATGFNTRSAATGAHVFCMLIPLVSVYLLGPRMGLVFTLMVSVDAALARPLLLGQSALTWGREFSTAFSLLSGWALTCLLFLARDNANLALERALRSLREHERKLTSLLENTEDVVCSVDAQGRLIAANPALGELYREVLGREPRPGEPLFPEGSPVRLLRTWKVCANQVLAGKRVRFEASPSLLKRPRVLDISVNPVVGLSGQVVGMTIFGRDITERKAAETQLGEMHRSLVEASRKAGMAEIATGVLHNVGNALNSVNVSVNLMSERLKHSRVQPGLARAASLLGTSTAELSAFLAEDARGRQLPDYLRALSEQLGRERSELLDEVRTLLTSLDHIKSVVSMQQQHARFSDDVVERLDVTGLLDDALRLQAVALERVGIGVRREYTEGDFVRVDRHKLLQILLNFLSNARHALVESGRADKLITIRVQRVSDARLRIAVVDNGIGIAPEDASRLFTQGFTTKKDGHGFGLHTSALAAAEMDASLSCASEGRGQGATFIIELPVSGEESRV